MIRRRSLLIAGALAPIAARAQFFGEKLRKVSVIAGYSPEDPVAQWRSAKTAASDAILATGGSISHHHGVGTDHVPWYEREVGSLGTGVLRAVKAELDPVGILNPGVLIPLHRPSTSSNSGRS